MSHLLDCWVISQSNEKGTSVCGFCKFEEPSRSGEQGTLGFYEQRARRALRSERKTGAKVVKEVEFL